MTTNQGRKLQRTLNNRLHVYLGYLTLMMVSFLLFTPAINSVIYHFLYQYPLSKLDFFFAFIGILFPLLQVWFLLRPVGYSKVIVNESGVSLHGPTENKTILFQDVIGFEIHQLPVVGGWYFLITQDGLKHRFTQILERSEYVIDALISARPEFANRQNIQKFRNHTIAIDHIFARFEDNFLYRWYGFFIKYLILPFVITCIGSYYFHMIFIDTLKNFLYLNTVIGYFIYFVSEYYISQKTLTNLNLNPLEVRRSTPTENQVRFASNIVHLLTMTTIVALSFMKYLD